MHAARSDMKTEEEVAERFISRPWFEWRDGMAAPTCSSSVASICHKVMWRSRQEDEPGKWYGYSEEEISSVEDVIAYDRSFGIDPPNEISVVGGRVYARHVCPIMIRLHGNMTIFEEAPEGWVQPNYSTIPLEAIQGE